MCMSQRNFLDEDYRSRDFTTPEGRQFSVVDKRQTEFNANQRKQLDQERAGGIVKEARWLGDNGGGERDREQGVQDVLSDANKYLDTCAWRVLHAASRTATGGDSFFVVQDLFGGDGVLIKPTMNSTEAIEIVVKDLAVQVTTVDKYDIHHIADVDEADSTPQPLMTINTRIKEVIQFLPFQDTLHKGTWLVQDEDLDEEGPPTSTYKRPRHEQSQRLLTVSAQVPNNTVDKSVRPAPSIEAVGAS
ncbi:unnamed protein product [Choristocarpus tenellus]